MTPDESHDLPKQWIVEIQDTSRPGAGPRVADLVSRSIQRYAEQDFEEAARLAEEAQRQAPRSPRILELLGLANYQLGRWRQTLSFLGAFRRMTGSQEQNHLIADTYRALGRPDRALEICAEVTEGSVSEQIWAETMIVAAGALADKGEASRALTMLARADAEPASGLQPHHLRLWYVRADLLEGLGRKAEAGRLWSRIMAEDPEFFDVPERAGQT